MSWVNVQCLLIEIYENKNLLCFHLMSTEILNFWKILKIKNIGEFFSSRICFIKMNIKQISSHILFG